MRWILLVFLLVFFLVTPFRAQADVKLIHVFVKGMVCGFCANGLKKTFAAEPAVASLTVSLDLQELKLFIKDGQTISDLEIENAVKNAGFTLREIKR